MTDSAVDTVSVLGSSRVAAVRTPLRAAIWVGLYIALIPFVNWSFTWAPNWRLIGDFAFNPVTIVTGLILVVRDFAQRQIGHRIFFAMLVALVLTVWGAGLMLAIASGTAFFVSELIDWGLFTFTKASLPRRVLISTAVAAPVDTLVFLSLASYVRIDSFSVPNMIMSIVGKLLGLAVVLLLNAAARAAGLGFAMRSLFVCAFVLSTLSPLTPSAVANDVRPQTFELQARRSDAVVVGRLIQDEITTGPRVLRLGTFEVLTWLKGETHESTIRVVLAGEIAEFALPPLSRDGTYVLCLRRGTDGLYYPTNGPHSAWPVSTPSP